MQLIFPEESWHMCIPAVYPCCLFAFVFGCSIYQAYLESYSEKSSYLTMFDK